MRSYVIILSWRKSNNKYKLLKVAEKIGIPCVKFYEVSNIIDLEKKLKSFGWPKKRVVIKPPLSRAICSKCKLSFTGVRPGEKIHEEMITSSDSFNTFDIGKYYAIISPSNKISYNMYKKNNKNKKFKVGASLNSNNTKFLTIKELKKIISQNLYLVQ